MNESNQGKKIILFSTRFLENEDYLFSKGNYYDDDMFIKSPEFKKYFLSKKALLSMSVNINTINYFNRIICFDFFEHYKDERNMPLISIEDSYLMIRDKIKKHIPREQRKSLSEVIKKFNKNTEKKLFAINISKGEFCDEEANDEKIESCYYGILKFDGQSINNDIVLNTDFGKAVDKRTIDRRFKIYKLKTENSKEFPNIPVYAVWCLSVGKKETAEDWYKALYKELKFQLGDDEFGKIDEILYFLHDGDIDAKKPFDVIKYKETNAEFSFLDENKRLSVAIFDHSNSLVAKSLRTSDIDEAIGIAMAAMESGGKRAFLYKLSDCIARWTETGKEEYKKETTKDKLDRFPDITLKYTSKDGIPDDVSVFDIYADVKQQIDILENRL